jgi:hypothetical protein
MKFAAAAPETAARKLVEIASSIEPVQDGRSIHIERSTARSCKRDGTTTAHAVFSQFVRVRSHGTMTSWRELQCE